MLEIVVFIALVVACTAFLRTFVIGVYEIPSGSMIDTLEIGDRIVSEKISYLSSDPVRGDIVTFDDPEINGRTLIKRVIATEGQTIDFDGEGHVVVDGVILYEPYTDGKQSYPFESTAPDVEISYPYTVPDGCIWVMGDNRTDSQDSRYFGAVQTDSVTSKAFLRIFPFDRAGLID